MFAQQKPLALTLKGMLITDVPAMFYPQRPQMTVKITPDFLQEVANAVGSAEKLSMISNAELAKLLPGMVEYSGKLVDALAIPGGWDKPRCAFNMIYEQDSPLGQKNMFVVAGFTDGRPRDDGDKLNWDGVNFYVNFIQALRLGAIRTSAGIRTLFNVAHGSVVLSDHGQYPNQRYNRIRPSDVFNGIDSLQVAADQDIIDTRTLVTPLPVFSKREHVIPAAWLGEIMRGYGIALQADMGGLGMEALYHSARGVVTEQSPMHDPLMRAISQETGYNHGAITLRGLKRVFPDLDDKTTYVTDGHKEKPIYVEGKKEWHAPAMLVGLGTTGLMAASGLAMIQFQATNIVQDGEQAVVVTAAAAMSAEPIRDFDVSPLIEQFKQRFIDEILPQISYNGQQSFTLQVTAHFGAETQVRIGSGMPGEEEHVRTIPTYADSLLTPLIYTDAQEKDRLGLAEDVSTLLDVVQPKTSYPGDFGN